MSEQPIATTDQSNERPFDIVLVDQSHDAQMAARAEADARLTAELGEGGRVRRFVSGIWKGNIAKDYYRHKYEGQALKQIEASQDILLHESSSQVTRDEAMFATIRRFQSDYEEMIHTEAGERRQEIAGGDITDGLKNIVREYAEGRLDDTNLLQERARLLQAYREQNGDELLGAGTVQVDNLLDVARAVRGAVSHGESVDDIVNGMRIITAESRSGVRTEVEYSRTDKVIEKLGNSKLGLILGSEATIAAASIAASVARFGSTRAVGAAAMTIAPGIGAGLLAGLREKKHVKDDRAQHSRELAQGKEFNENDTRRSEMETTRYQTVRATDLTEQVRSHLHDGALEHDDALQAALDSLAAIRAREHLSDSSAIDLIVYSEATSIEQERFDLALARAELKVALNGRLDDDARQRLGLDETASIDELVRVNSDAFIEQYQEDITAKDEAFRKLRNRRVAKAAAIGVATGLTFGIVSQEIGAAISDSREGLLEQAWGHETKLHEGSVHESLLQGMFGQEQTAAYSGESGVSEQAALTKEKFGDHGRIKFSDNLQLQEQAGRLEVHSAGGTLIADVKLRQDGSLGNHAIAKLQASGMNVEDLSRTVMVETTETKTVGVQEFMQNHRGETTPITRDLWYDNNTVAPTFEANELGLHWGGEGGRDAQGGVVMNVATMTADGSFHASEATNWAQDARTENLKLAISPTGDTQARPFLVDINPNGTVNIAADSPAAQFFSTENGQTVFNGRYAEVVQMTGADEQGVEHVRALATLVGTDNLETVNDTVVTQSPELRPRYEITMPVEAAAVEAGPFVEMAPVIPLVSRRSLERAQRRERYMGYGYYGTGDYSRTLKELDIHGSPRLRDNPDAKLNLGQEVNWFASKLKATKGEGYASRIESAIDASPELSSINQNIETIVTIPVKASGQEESDNIYGQLRMFAQQGQEALSKNLMLLHLNWPIKAENDADARARIQRTHDEIQRAKRDFPGLKVATIESRWTDQELEGGVIGRVAETMRDASLLSLRRAISDGRIASDQEVQIVRNDADAIGIHKGYLERMQEAFQSNGGVDIFTGTTRFDESRASELPGMVMGQHFAQTINILEMSRHGKAHTGGANFGVRAATLAAVAPALSNQDFQGVGSDDVMVGAFITAARGRPKYSGGSRLMHPLRSRYYLSQQPVTSGRKVAKRVVGAQIDTDSQRSEEAYLAGGYFHNTWDIDFDDGGHRERGMGMNDPQLIKRREELKNDIDAQVQILEKDIQYTTKISGGVHNPAVKTALEMMFSGLNGAAGYSITSRGVQLTPEGKKYLTNRMQRDSKGRFDPLGSRLSRQLYGQVKPGAKRTRANAPLLSVA